MRLTKKDFNYSAPILQKLGQLEDLMEKYNIKTLEQVESAFIGFVSDYTEEGRNHIGELLKLEDELGIDLVTLFKALKNGIWVKFYPLDYYEKETIKFAGKFYFGATFDFDKPIFRFYQREYKLKDYGKTWALTKEELE